MEPRAAKSPPVERLLGFKYDDTKTEEGRQVTVADMDAVDHLAHMHHGGRKVDVRVLTARSFHLSPRD